MRRLACFVVGIVLGAFAVSAAGRVTTQDPVKVSPQYYVVRFENERVRVLEFHLKPGEKVTFILNIHGAGSIGNWQRHYFPAMDYKEKYRLVIATPTAATSSPMQAGGPGVRRWVAEADDAHLQNITDQVFDAFGRKNIKAFWLVGHSQGGATSHRIVCSDFFKDKVDGLVSLSGGRIGRSEMNPRFGPPLADGSPPPPRPAAAGAAMAPPLPACAPPKPAPPYPPRAAASAAAGSMLSE